jgi:glutaminyl-peptide cyclotransferase
MRLLVRLLALVTAFSIAAAQSIPVWSGRVVGTFPRDAQAFTQGFIVENGFFYEGTGLYGQSALRKVELRTGRVLKSHPLPKEYFGEGITLFKNRIYQLTWQNQKGFIYDANLKPVGSFAYQTEGWGITHNGRQLIMSDGTANLYFLNTNTLKPERTLKVLAEGKPVTNLNELEFIPGSDPSKGYIYANVWQTSRIAVINPGSGKVEAWIDLNGLVLLARLQNPNPDAVLNGIAYDKVKRKLYVTGKLWSQVFEIELIR